jgi:mycothiol synthase
VGVTLPPGFRFRPARDEDAVPVADFANEETKALIGASLMSPDWLLVRWTAPSVDRENDVAVLEGPDGHLCGYLGLHSEPPYSSVFAIGVVAVPYHGRGVGAAIVTEIERRAERFLRLADPELRFAVHLGTIADEPSVSELAAAHGYREVRRMQLMRIDFSAAPAPPVPPPGIEVRVIHPERDFEPLYRAHIEAFADHWGEGTETYADFRHRVLESDEFDTDLWFLAWDGETVAGYVGARESSIEDSSRGYVDLLGVRRGYRRRGLGEVLLRQAFAVLYRRGKSGCDLHVDVESLTGATRLYERVGMTALPRFATWEKELRPGRRPVRTGS